MRTWMTTLALLALLGCGKGDDGGAAATAGDAARLNAEYGAFRERLCKCADEKCYQDVKRDTEAWLARNTSAMETARPTKEQEEEFDTIENGLEECAKKFEDTAAEPAPADPAQPTAPTTP